MLHYPRFTRDRLAQLTARLRGQIHRQARPVDRLLVSPRVERISHDDAMKLDYKPAKLGQQFGPIYATYWFKGQVQVPGAWTGRRVDLLWASHCEATLWMDGRSIQGLTQGQQERLDATLVEKAHGGQTVEFALEMACNDMFGFSGRDWPEHHSPVWLERADVALFDPVAWELYHDLLILQQLEAEQAGDSADLDKAWANKLLFDLNRFANTIDEQDRATWPVAGRILKDLLAHTNGSYTHELSAIGHAHIDTAWLWPLAETYRKCVRTFSTQARYMDEYPEYCFACSQACQYEWLKQRNPDLYRRIQAKVKSGQWVPVGGTWVEPDCNIPSGESLCRQFLFGQRFFEKEFGKRCREFWNPDVFGYNGQLPQIMRLAGVSRFLTQKLSWNTFNKPLYQTFHWQGLDGSTVLAHFPPADTYNGVCTAAELRRHAREYKESGHSQHGYLLFGYGDGGGGPTRTMLESLRRAKDLLALPRCTIRSSDQFFGLLEKEAQDLPTVVGELYFEFHRGTYTTQAATKRGNRKSEFLLHDIEFLAALADRLGTMDDPKAEVDRLWKIVLTNQFHDILPGSSVRCVYEDAARHYAEVAQAGEDLRQKLLAALAKRLGKKNGAAKGASATINVTPVNTLGVPRSEVARTPGGELAFVQVPACGTGKVIRSPDGVLAQQIRQTIVLENAVLCATLAHDGRLLELVHKPTGRQALSEPGNVLELYDDKPTQHEAWDVDPYILETGRPCAPASTMRLGRRDPLRAEVVFDRPIGKASRMTQTVRLDAGARRLEFVCNVDWQESQKMLKVAFPAAVRAMKATYEMPFGSVERPTHFNDNLAVARFEVPGHKWADLSEHGFGVALLSESKYGFNTRQNVLRMSLLRATKMPDPEADLGQHHFAYAIYPHAGGWQDGGVVAEALRFNVPVSWLSGASASRAQAFFELNDPNLILDTVKQAEESDALVLRLYECHGGRGTAQLKIGLPWRRATLCNVLEDELGPAKSRDGHLAIEYGPYQIITVRLG